MAHVLGRPVKTGQLSPLQVQVQWVHTSRTFVHTEPKQCYSSLYWSQRTFRHPEELQRSKYKAVVSVSKLSVRIQKTKLKQTKSARRVVLWAKWARRRCPVGGDCGRTWRQINQRISVQELHTDRLPAGRDWTHGAATAGSAVLSRLLVVVPAALHAASALT